MDWNRRNAQRKRQGGSDARPDQQCAGEARPGRVRQRVQIAHGESCLSERLADERDQAHDVVARSELGHDSAVGCVHGDLTMQRLGQQARSHAENGDPGFVARRFDAQDGWVGGSGAGGHRRGALAPVMGGNGREGGGKTQAAQASFGSAAYAARHFSLGFAERQPTIL